MKSLIEIQAEIESLQQQAAEIRKKDAHKVIEEILATMRAFGITHADLRRRERKIPRKTVGQSTPSRHNANKIRRKPAAVKYTGPAGQKWSGRGRKPIWLKELIAQGQAAEKYLVKDS